MEFDEAILQEIQQQFKSNYTKLLEDVNRIYTQGTMRDSFTGLYNKQAFEHASTSNHTGFVGILFADINGLKYTNDHKGHTAGDKLIKDFANLLKSTFNPASYKCYHLSGDEFIVAGFDIVIPTFLSLVVSFHKSLWDKDTYPIASLGYSAGEYSDLQQIVEYAEKAMYEDKQMFYIKYPNMKR